jgi:recombinational DNA repair protein (RecF pathway)
VLDALEGGLDPWVAVRYAEYWLLKLHGVLPDLNHCAGCGEPFAPRDVRLAAGGSGLFCKRCPKPAAAAALTPGDRAALVAIGTHAPAGVPVTAEAARPGGVLELLLKGALQDFAERSFKTYRHLRAATVMGA